MASLLYLLVLSSFLSLLSADPSPVQIRLACNATRFPDSCETSLSQAKLPTPPKPIDIILASIAISTQNVQTAQSRVKSILDRASNNRNLSTTATNCLESLHNSQHRLSLTSADALPHGRTKDARSWMSAALYYQYSCFSGLKYVNFTGDVDQTMEFLLSLIDLTSNSLSMVLSLDLFGDDLAQWRPPATERSGFWGNGVGGGGEGSGLQGCFPSKTAADAMVCKEGKGCYPTVQSAVDKVVENLEAGQRFVIYIKEGVYEETVRVPLEKKNVVFVGDGMGKTVITGDLNVGMPGVSTLSSATVGVFGDGFMARDLTIQNTAGPDAHQAVAFRSESDLSVLYNCEFLGHQDTLLASSLRQFYKSCRIAGNVDFIFGNSAAVFDDCLILVVPRQLEPEKGETNAVTAHGRTDPAQSTGFVFHNCTIIGTDDYMALYNKNPKVHRNYLGRPWKEFSRTVFINSYLGSLISPEGWALWDGNFALSTLYYGEFENTGPGANSSSRVKWSSQIPPEHASFYSVQNFIQGNEWIPSDSK